MNVVAVHTDGFYSPNTITTLTGKVVVTQGTLKATGDKALVYMDADQQISRIVITGNPAHIEQIDDNGNLMTGDALTLDYDNINGIAVLTTNAVVHQQGRGEAHGDKLTYNTQTSYMTGSSSGDGLVHMIILPKPQPATAKPAAPAKPAAGTTPAPATTSTTAKPAPATSAPAAPAPGTPSITHGQP